MKSRERHNGTEGRKSVTSGRAVPGDNKVDPHLEKLVRYLARCAAERDYEAIQKKQRTKDCPEANGEKDQ